MTFDPTTIANSNIQQINIASGKRPASDITDPTPVLLNVPSTCEVFSDLQPADPSDDFAGSDGDAPDVRKWEIDPDAVNWFGTAYDGTVDIQSNELSLAVDTDYCAVLSKFKFSGEFEFTIDYSKASSSSNSILDIIDGGDDRIYYQIIPTTNIPSVRQSIAASWDTATTGTAVTNSGEIKVSRNASNVISFYVDDVLTSTRTLSADVLVRLRSLDDDTTFDNFTVNSGTIIWPDSPKQLAVLDSNDDQCPVEIDVWERGPEPVSRWDFDNISGSTLEDVVGTDDGTISGMTDTAGGPFDRYLAGGDNGTTLKNIDYGASRVSFEALSFWVQLVDATITTNQYIIQSKPTTWEGIAVDTSNNLVFYDGSTINDTGHNIADLSWHHIVIVEDTDNNTHWVFLDGVKSATSIQSNFAGGFRYFNRENASAGTDCSNVTNVQVFDFIPTDAQIAMLYAAGERGNQYTANHANLHTLLPGIDATAPTYDALLCWDETQDDNDVRSAADASDDFTGTDGEAPDVGKWVVTSGNPTIQSSSLEISVYSGTLTGSIQSRFKVSGDLDVQVDYSGFPHSTASDLSHYITIYVDASNYIQLSRIETGGNSYLITQHLAGSTTYQSVSTTDTDGKLRITRTSTAIACYYWNGSNWTQVGSNFTFITSGVDIRLGSGDWATADTGTTVFDNFTVNSADSITGYIGDTGDTAAQAVWPSEYKAVYHMSQDPSGSAPQMLDSTSNALDLTANGSMTTADLADALVGKAIDFDNTDDFLSHASLGSISDITIEAIFKTPANSANLGIASDYEGATLGGWLFYVAADGTLAIDGRGVGDGYANASTTSAYDDDDWHYAAARRDSGVFKIWADDGTDTGSDGTGSGAMANTYGFIVGAYKVGSSAVTSFFNKHIAEIKVSHGVARSDEYLTLQNLSLTDTLFDWSDYTSSTSNIQFWNMPYDDLIANNVAYWNEIYSILFPRVQSWDEIYGILLTTYWNLPYGNNPLLSKYWDERYGDNPIIRQWFDLRYDDRVSLLKYWDEKYNLNKGILQHWNEGYAILGKELVKYFDENYDIKNTNPVLKHFDEYYHIMADSVVEAAALGFYIDGVRYEGPHHASFELNVDSYKNTGEMHFNYPTPFFAASEGTEMRIVDTDIDLFLDITIPTKRETVRETTYIIPGESKSRRLEIANVFTEDFENTTAETIITTVAGREGISVDWQIPDWPLELYSVNDQTPYQVIYDLVSNTAKAVIQSDFNGDIYITKAREANTNEYDTATPTYLLEDNLHFFSTNQRGERKPGYNKYRATDQSESDEVRTTLEDDEYGVASRIVKAFRVPWDGVALTLYTSDNNANILYQNIVTEELTEAISVVNGEGDSNTSKPFYSLVSWSYNDTDLGTPTVTEEGIVQTPTDGQSLLTITYLTRYYKWLVTDYDDKEIQVWVE